MLKASSKEVVPWFDRTPLRSPLWWGALAVLLVNDGLLKGHGVVPGWLTGKLSDFAFLLVAPILFAVLLPRRLPGRRTLAVVAVTGLFVAADLSPPVSEAVVAVAARLGLRWRLWPDPTDLLALAILPATVWLLRTHTVGARPFALTPPHPRLRESTGVVLGALACVATSAPPGYVHSPFLVNRTAAAAEVRITWVLRQFACGTTPTALAASLDPSDLDDPRTFTFASGDAGVLHGPLPAGASPVGQCASDALNSFQGKCVAAILEAPGATPVLMVAEREWYERQGGGFIDCNAPAPPVSACKPHFEMNADAGVDAVSLVDKSGIPTFELAPASVMNRSARDGGFARIQLEDVDPAAIAARAPTAAGCRASRDNYRAALNMNACARDADCASAEGAPLPGEESACSVYVNQSALGALRAAATSWSARCLSDEHYCSPTPQPAVCNAGRCAAACPGAFVPRCPDRCTFAPSTNTTAERLCGGNPFPDCLDDDGQRCSCTAGRIVCAPIPPISSTCRLTCIPNPVSAKQEPSRDGGTQDAASADAGS